MDTDFEGDPRAYKIAAIKEDYADEFDACVAAAIELNGTTKSPQNQTILRAFSGILAEPSSTEPYYQVISEMQQKNSGSITPASGFRVLGLDDIIARDDAAELADFIGRSLCSSHMPNGGRNAVVRFRNHTIEIDMRDALAIKIDGAVLDLPSHPALTDLLLSLMSALQPTQPIALAS